MVWANSEAAAALEQENAFNEALNKFKVDNNTTSGMQGTDENGLPIYKNNFAEGVTYGEKQYYLHQLVKEVFSKKPIELSVIKNGIPRKIMAEFSTGTDAAHIASPSRSASNPSNKVKANLSNDLYEMTANAEYDYSKPEVGKYSIGHENTKEFHYFINSFSYNGRPYDLVIDIKDTGQSQYVYTYTVKKKSEAQINELRQKRTGIYADPAPALSEEPAVSLQDNNSISTFSENVNINLSSQTDSAEPSFPYAVLADNISRVKSDIAQQLDDEQRAASSLGDAVPAFTVEENVPDISGVREALAAQSAAEQNPNTQKQAQAEPVNPLTAPLEQTTAAGREHIFTSRYDPNIGKVAVAAPDMDAVIAEVKSEDTGVWSDARGISPQHQALRVNREKTLQAITDGQARLAEILPRTGLTVEQSNTAAAVLGSGEASPEQLLRRAGLWPVADSVYTDISEQVDYLREQNEYLARNAETSTLSLAATPASEVLKWYEEKNALQSDYDKAKAKLTPTEVGKLEKLESGAVDRSGIRDGITGRNVLAAYDASEKLRFSRDRVNEHRRQMRMQKMEFGMALISGSEGWQDYRTGLGAAINTPTRLWEDIAGKNDPEGARRILESLVKVHEDNNTNMIRAAEAYRLRISDLGISEKPQYKAKHGYDIINARARARGKGDETSNRGDAKFSEAEIVMLYGEKLINDSDLSALGIDSARINKCVDTLREIYGELFAAQNEVLVANGYPPMAWREDYMPHYAEDESIAGWRGKVYNFAKKAGWLDERAGDPALAKNIPDEIVGMTEGRTPNKRWFANAMRRLGNRTGLNVLKGFDIYLGGSLDVIYHTGDIQNVRAVERALRYKYSDKGKQATIRNILESNYSDDQVEVMLTGDILNAEEQAQSVYGKMIGNNDDYGAAVPVDAAKEKEIKEVLKEDLSHMSNLVLWLQEYGNQLANKKSIYDRPIEYLLGRGVYETARQIEGRYGSNVIGGNLSVAVSNLIPLATLTGEVNPQFVLRAARDAIRPDNDADFFFDESAFVSKRTADARGLHRSAYSKISDTLSVPMNAVDDFSTKIVARSYFLQELSRGVDEKTALRNADDFAARIMASRNKGEMATIHSVKNPLIKIATMFQVESINQLQYMFKDLPRKYGIKAAGVLTRVFIGHMMYNLIREALTGTEGNAFDPFGWVIEYFRNLYEPDEEGNTESFSTATGELLKNLGGQIPVVSIFTGGGRVPVLGSLDDASQTWNTAIKAVSGEGGTKAWVDLGKDAASFGANFLLPSGGSQLKKSIEGIATVAQGAEYGMNKDDETYAKYIVDKSDPLTTALKYVRAGLFGKNSLPEARQYIDDGFKAQLTPEQTEAWRNLVHQGVENGMLMEEFDAQEDITGDEDENGRTISGSEGYNRKQSIDEMGLDDDQRVIMYDAMEILPAAAREKRTEAENEYGISPAAFYDAYYGVQQAEGLKDLQGRTVSGSAGLAKRIAVDNIPGLDDNQRHILYDYLNISDSVAAKTSAQVSAEYAGMKRKYAMWNN